MPKRPTGSCSFSPSLTKVATLVASRMQMARTPVAVGSSVPVWPQRLVLNRPFTRRTTSKLVGPLGLSTTTTPERSLTERLLDLVGDPGAHRALVTFNAAPGRVVMPAAAELLRDRRDVDAPARPEGDAPRPAILRLAERRGDFHAVDRARVVDEAVGQVGRAAGL